MMKDLKKKTSLEQILETRKRVHKEVSKWAKWKREALNDTKISLKESKEQE